jgi:phage-related protein
MSSIISGLNIKNIYEYDSTLSYNKFDVVDYELVTGISVYPSYTGLGNSGLIAWFNNDYLEDFNTDGSFNITGWKNKVVGSGDLIQLSSDANVRPDIQFDQNYITLKDLEFLSGTGFDYTNRTFFLAVDVIEPEKKVEQKIIKFGTDVSLGSLKINGNNTESSASVLLDADSFYAVSPIYNHKNIFTIIQNSTASTLTIRQNGFNIGQAASYDSQWNSNYFELGNNPKNSGIKYYDLFYFSGILSETEIDYYEKYFFEKYFSDYEGLFFAKKNVPVGEAYSPITYTGKNYWTRDIDDLFKLSYGSSVNFSAKLSPLTMGDGYRTNTANNVNTLNATFNLNYDGLTDTQSKCLIAYFENTPEAPVKSLYEGFKAVDIDLFTPYKLNAQVYFKSIDHNSTYNNINKITINTESLFDSSLDYKGMFVVLDEKNIKTYTNYVDYLLTNDVFYFNSDSYLERGYYFYTGVNLNPPSSSTGPSSKIYIAPNNSPTGINSWFTKDFYFKGDLEYEVNENIRLLSNDMKNSTIEYSKDGINYNVLELNVGFKKRTTQEARAILKFLDDKAGFKTFKYTLPQPYNKIIDVYCPEWNHTYNFENNHDISVKFIEFKNPFNAISVFNTNITLVE